MKKHFAPGIVAVAVLALAAGAAAQTAPPAGSAKSDQASAPTTTHHKHGTTSAKHEADLKAECQAMMAKKHEMMEKVQAGDATLDRLIAEMNAAKGSKEPDAMEKPMAAVITELVAQQKALHASMTEMQPGMMTHMAHHMHAHGSKGAGECPMMKEDQKSGM